MPLAEIAAATPSPRRPPPSLSAIVVAGSDWATV